MNNTLVLNWNDRVQKNDIVYHLGDFTFGDELSAHDYILKLNGHIQFIWGNHDKAMYKLYRFLNRFTELREKISFIGDFAEIKVQGQRICLMHYAMKVWPRSHHGSWHLYGHSHGTLPDDPNSLSFDVGVDCHDFAPIHFGKIKELMSKKTFTPIDHHGKPNEIPEKQ